MVTMPLAGWLTDKDGPRQIRAGRPGVIALGMGVFTQPTDTTSYV
jgi:hypothetical protein